MNASKEIEHIYKRMSELGPLKSVCLYVADHDSACESDDIVYMALELSFSEERIFLVVGADHNTLRIMQEEPECIEVMERHDYSDVEPWNRFIGRSVADVLALMNRDNHVQALQLEFHMLDGPRERLQIESMRDKMLILYGGKEKVLW